MREHAVARAHVEDLAVSRVAQDVNVEADALDDGLGESGFGESTRGSADPASRMLKGIFLEATRKHEDLLAVGVRSTAVYDRHVASRVVHDPAELVQQAAGASLIAVDGRMAVGKTTLSRGLAQAVRGTIIQTDWFFESQWGRNTRELVYADILDIEALAVRIRNAQKRGPIILDGICVLDVLGRVGVTADLHVLVTVALPGDARFRCGVDPAMEGRAGPSGVNDAALLDDDLTLEQLMAELRKEWGPYDLITERSVASYFKVFRPHRNADTIYLRK